MISTTNRILHGDCRDMLRTLADCSVDSIVTDPPYELGFMGKHWDASGIAYNVDLWRECLRVLKPGGHLLAFGGTRTYHRMAVAIEDAGFEIRDSIHWLYGSGFPKSLDVSKAIDKAAGAEREVVGPTRRGAQSVATNAFGVWGDGITPTAPATDAAKQWDGWGTALKPAHETVILARKVPGWEVDFSPVPILEVALWLLSDASDAIASSRSSRADYVEALCGSARRLAEQRPATPADLLAATATWLSAWATDTSWSTVSSWLSTWHAISEAMSTSTISTASSTTTALRTFRYLVEQTTRESTIPDLRTNAGRQSPAWLAVEMLCAELSNLSGILGLPAPVSATSVLQDACPDEVARPAHEPIVVARKPLIGTVAANVLQYGTGAINVDGGRVAGESTLRDRPAGSFGSMNDDGWTPSPGMNGSTLGRWPANLVLTHAADCADSCAAGCPVAELDRQSGTLTSGANPTRRNSDKFRNAYGDFVGQTECTPARGIDTGGASRFFTVTEWDVPFRYIAKPSKRERNAGLGGLEERAWRGNYGDGIQDNRPHTRDGYTYETTTKNHHPTVKPLALMRWLVRLVTPPGGIVLDPFLGSGTTAAAAVLEGFDWVGCELTDDYLPIIEGRTAWAQQQVGYVAPTRITSTDSDQLALF